MYASPAPSLDCRSRLGCFSGSRVPGLIRCRWTGTRRPSSTIWTAQWASIPEPSWLKRTTGCSVTPTASTCPTGGPLSAAAAMHRWVGGRQTRSYIHPLKSINKYTSNMCYVWNEKLVMHMLVYFSNLVVRGRRLILVDFFFFSILLTVNSPQFTPVLFQNTWRIDRKDVYPSTLLPLLYRHLALARPVTIHFVCVCVTLQCHQCFPFSQSSLLPWPPTRSPPPPLFPYSLSLYLRSIHAVTSDILWMVLYCVWSY